MNDACPREAPPDEGTFALNMFWSGWEACAIKTGFKRQDEAIEGEIGGKRERERYKEREGERERARESERASEKRQGVRQREGERCEREREQAREREGEPRR